MSTDTYDYSSWKLTTCCGVEEKIFLAFYFAYGILIHFLFKYELLYPFKLLAVFVHEMGHGSAAWLTCGKVKSIVVNLDQSGTASYTGGLQWMIIPAGYVGGAFWGGAFVALSGSRIGATVAACTVSTALLIALAYVLDYLFYIDLYSTMKIYYLTFTFVSRIFERTGTIRIRW
jgi:hypothetical protein